MKKYYMLCMLLVTFMMQYATAQNTSNCNAQFSFSIQSGNNVQFVPAMPGDSVNTQHLWKFGDGTQSNAVAPSHIYVNAGGYAVTHIITRYGTGAVICRDTVVKTLQVQASCDLIAGFTDSIVSAGTYKFQNTSIGLAATDSIRWTFGDGSSSNQYSPTHTYTQSGTYIVCLRIQKRNNTSTTPGCVKEICKTIVVQLPGTCNLSANFSFAKETTTATPYDYRFTNTSTGFSTTDSIRWNFGDGNYSNAVNPVHNYAQPGTYTVCLKIIKRTSNGTVANCSSEKCYTLVIENQNTCTLTASFTKTMQSPNTFYFHNTSTPLASSDSIRWTFGDGSTSTAVDATHTYTQPGTYVVCLRVKKNNPAGTTTAACVKEVCDTVIVQNSNTCNLVASFTFRKDSTTAYPYDYKFTNTSTPLAATDSIRWSFGDGTYSNAINPFHAYAQPGTYTVCLRVIKRTSAGTISNCIKEVCHTVVVTNDCNVQANFTWRADSANSRKIFFTNTSVASTAAATVLWKFGDGSTSTVWNAVHEYANPGRYLVCIRIQWSNSCVAEFCDSITVSQPEISCIQQSTFNMIKAASNSKLVYFKPAYINPNWQYTWTFGDGTGSHETSPSHTYLLNGNYTACLTVYRNANCASTTCKPVSITNQVNCDSFQLSYNTQVSPANPNKVYFQAISNVPLTSQTWIINRYPASTTFPPVALFQPNPSYVFPDTGTYRVCLKAVTAGNCVKEFCKLITISQVAPPACNLQPYPNPAGNTVTVDIQLSQPEIIKIYIYNSLNILVRDKQVQGLAGNNAVSVAIGDLVAGVYGMKVIYGNMTCSTQFVKL